MIAQSPEHGFQRTRPLLLLGANSFPFGEVLPTGGEPAESALGTVGDDNQGIVPEQMGNGVFVVAEIVMEGGGNGLVNPFELHQQQGYAVDKGDEVGSVLDTFRPQSTFEMRRGNRCLPGNSNQ